MIKWIIIIAVAIVAIIIFAVIADGKDEPGTISDPPAPPVRPQRQAVAKQAADKMNSAKMHNVGSEALQIKRVVYQRNLRINTGALNNAQDKISRICSHAELIRNDVQRYCNNPQYLQDLYRKGVGLSDEAYNLSVEVKAMQETLKKLSSSNKSLVPLYNQVRAFCSSICGNVNALNHRNAILRHYIGFNFGPRERAWYDRIQARIDEKRRNS